ncbi:hypothetical protein ACNKHM_27925 [Shigella sonnei]
MQAIFDAVDELSQESPGDIPFYERRARNSRYRRCAEQAELTPYRHLAALCTAFQQRTEPRVPVAQRATHCTATNVAETSLTVPGIKYVIDPGTARISRYSYRTKRSVCRLSQFRRLQLISVKAAAVVCQKGSVFVSIPKTISSAPVHPPRNSAHQPGLGYFADDRTGLGDIAAFPFVEHRRNAISRMARVCSRTGRLPRMNRPAPIN